MLAEMPDLQKTEGGYTLSGDVTKNTAHMLPTELKCDSQEVCRVDLAQVSRSDSAAVSVFLNWIRNSKSSSKQIQFDNMPANLQSLIQLYGVESLIYQT